MHKGGVLGRYGVATLLGVLFSLLEAVSTRIRANVFKDDFSFFFLYTILLEEGKEIMVGNEVAKLKFLFPLFVS